MVQHLDTQTHISMICDQIKELLLEKNSKYGDSALNPARIFSKADATEQILVRIDDKLNRIQKGAGRLSSTQSISNSYWPGCPSLTRYCDTRTYSLFSAVYDILRWFLHVFMVVSSNTS